MPRNCAICENQMSSFVREKYKEHPSSPKAVIKAVWVKYSIKITYAQLRNHKKMHDPLAGTMVQAHRTVTSKGEELIDLVNSGRQIIANLEGLLVKGTELEGLNWEQFAAMPLAKQVKLQIEMHKLALAVKQLEMKQESMNREKNAMLGRMNNMAANTFKSKPKPIVVEEPAHAESPA